METRICSKCKIEKSILDFHKDICKSGGIQGQCKSCRCKDVMNYHWNHRDEDNKRCHEYQLKNKDKISKRKKEYNRNHIDEINKKQKEYYKNNRDARCKYMKEIYYPTHREDCLNYLGEWREDNKDLLYEGQKRYRQSENGKIAFAKVRSKRKRNLGFNILFENILDEPVAWHHIDTENVIAVPKDLHELFGRGKDVQIHRDHLQPIINQLYPETRT